MFYAQTKGKTFYIFLSACSLTHLLQTTHLAQPHKRPPIDATDRLHPPSSVSTLPSTNHHHRISEEKESVSMSQEVATQISGKKESGSVGLGYKWLLWWSVALGFGGWGSICCGFIVTRFKFGLDQIMGLGLWWVKPAACEVDQRKCLYRPLWYNANLGSWVAGFLRWVSGSWVFFFPFFRHSDLNFWMVGKSGFGRICANLVVIVVVRFVVDSGGWVCSGWFVLSILRILVMPNTWNCLHWKCFKCKIFYFKTKKV